MHPTTERAPRTLPSTNWAPKLIEDRKWPAEGNHLHPVLFERWDSRPDQDRRASLRRDGMFADAG
jgi:hypothetical protein